ncbi:hypothetical protein BDU57DRAFT_513003 [Ampelomyces quisqualis]|uniref:Nucleoporin complex subunit 54-domain-containing protein n=1 Tax=Ampelomyces quisqualis TaxID=50730 RepID=A0A6A5QYK5_AMPQU|nr:hypothetical protein BDU57DRAFT_513003 [Ampelomyces quisqualis]
MAGFGRSNSLSINTGGGGAVQNQPQSSGGLFGASQQPAQAASGGLFGAAAAGSNASKLAAPGAPSTSLFGASTQPTTAPSLFASTNPQPQTAAPSLFGSNQQQPQQHNTLFGMNPQNRAAPLGGSSMGAGAPQPVQMTLDAMRGTTRFNDLHPDLQSVIQQLDLGIQQKISYCNQIRETLPSSEQDIATIAPDVAYIETYLSTVETGLDNDSTDIAHLKDVVKRDAADATLSFRAIENQRLPAQFHYRNSANLTASSAKAPAAGALDDDDPTKPVDLMTYFNHRTDDLGRTLHVYQRQIREIEAHLRTMEAGTVEKAQQLTGSRSAPRDQRRELVEALKAIEGAILESAKKVGQVRDDVTKHTFGSVGATLL